MGSGKSFTPSPFASRLIHRPVRTAATLAAASLAVLLSLSAIAPAQAQWGMSSYGGTRQNSGAFQRSQAPRGQYQPERLQRGQVQRGQVQRGQVQREQVQRGPVPGAYERVPQGRVVDYPRSRYPRGFYPGPDFPFVPGAVAIGVPGGGFAPPVAIEDDEAFDAPRGRETSTRDEPPRRQRDKRPAVTAKPKPAKAAAAGGGGNKPPQTAVRPASPSAWNGIDGAPPAGEGRFVPDHIVCVLREGISDPEITRFLRSHKMERTPGGRQQVGLIGAQLFRYRITDRRAVTRVVAELKRDPRVLYAQPDYLYDLTQDNAGTAPPRPNPAQYVVGAMHLDKAHQIARGDKVLVAVIDSKIDAAHPELRGAIAKQIDVLDEKDFTPHAHGTAMAGAIVAKSQLTGVAPAAQIVAIRAFASRSSSKASGTSFQLTRAIDSAVEAGARVINLSFAGPADPMLSRAMKLARERGVVLVAAMGNAGPKSGPLYPAADPNVIAVTATDAEDRRYTDATPGGYVAVAAPGVDVLVPAPNEEYGLSTGTSVATAHVSGVVALLLSRRPSLTPEAIRGLLTAAARKPAEPDPALGAGIADAYGAVVATENGTTAQPGAALQETRPALTMQ